MSTSQPNGPPRRLYVMRHAKSSWKEPDRPDFARPLNGRGRRAAPRMGQFIASEHGLPDLVLCSAARRAVETYCELSREWDAWPELRVTAAFYACDPQVWLEAVSSVPDTVRTVMIVGHMPELYEVVAASVGPDRAPDVFPTAALAVIDCEGGWSELGPETCRLASFQVPKDL